MAPGKVLILFASREGQTAKTATRLSEHLLEAGVDVDLVDAADSARTGAINLEAYDLLVFGASMHLGGLERELVRFVNSQADQISQKPRSFFLVLLSAATKDPLIRAEWLADAQGKVQQALSVDFPDTEMVAGALSYSKYSLPVRWLMKKIAGQVGADTDTSRDYEYTDWAQVRHYAGRLRDRLREK